MWLQLTLFDGTSIRVNMNLVSSYMAKDDTVELSVGNEIWVVKETMEQIDKLRCVGWK